ncbi:hypothetical protein AV540_02315 [Brevibacillus parabrevis]|uniref:DUF7660 family protein n=1 Tax=Brevibacillus parabrevis TaxID=54914 RepID=UPI0007AC17AC|nr:hypothetical protein [Brevibacillus parabrevis]KZE44153.1 hypothetical protein AV540_02315 [Brevibacillus parabrevis]
MNVGQKDGQAYTKQDLIEFIHRSLAELENNPDWENVSLSHYLESMAAWLDTHLAPDAPSWEAFAKILEASKYYE